MSTHFNRFVNFGPIADSNVRQKLSDIIFESLQKKDFTDIGLSNSEINNFADAINGILSNETMRELCSTDLTLTEQVTHSILDFVKNTHRQIQKAENPFEAERQRLDEFRKTEPITFKENWEATAPFIQETYEKRILDTDFYYKEFQNSLEPEVNKDNAEKKKKRKKINFQSVKEHFIERWEELLLQKQILRELEQIEKERKRFCDELYKQIEELKKLQEVLEPFTNQLGRLWDMSKGRWQRANFDILKRYAELLKKNESLRELAEMLGRMRSTEIEYEEETFADKKIVYEWKIVHAGKSDLVGIHESDDISNMLPAEAALLAVPELKTIFYRKFVEKKLQTFEYQAKELSHKEEEFENKRQKAKENKKGPIIICVDTSGSMHGTPEQVAKTLSFALLKIAIGENRKCYLISFSTGIETLELTDMRNNLEKLLDFLSMSFCGGTDAMPAMKEALRMLETEDYKKADVVMVSDFVMPGFDGNTRRKVLSAKENKTKFHSLVIGNSGNRQTIEEFDNNWVYNSNDPRRAITLVKNIKEI
jgi:uncharacterized protein with von Willebrand factor type A (vWA) domain